MKTEFFINNRAVYAEGGWTILQACERIGLFIPRFCYSESLSIAGNCRMCLVEIEKSPKLMPACAIKVNNDMRIHTKTNLVKRTRESILEFLLINHPLDCPIRDQGGECDLQDQAMIYGSDRGRFHEYKRSLEDKNGGPLTKTIMTRCIHCTRCIRFATEIAGIETYGTSGRGKGMEVGTYIAKLFESESSGNVIDLCPVGALTSKPYAFTVRPWELKSTESIDILDAIGSNIRIDTRGSELMRMLPKNSGTINQQWITDKIRFSYDGLKCQRLNHPMFRTKTGFITIGWKQAFSLILESISRDSQGDTENPVRGWKHFGRFEQVSGRSPIRMKGIIGNLSDQKTILWTKKFLNRLGISKITPENLPFGVDTDFRSHYLLPALQAFGPQHLEEAPGTSDTSRSRNSQDTDYILLVGTNPRFEASLSNVRLRQLILFSQSRRRSKNEMGVAIASLGSPANLTYPVEHWGNNARDVFLLGLGKHTGAREMIRSNPMVIFGLASRQRSDGRTLSMVMEQVMLWHTQIRRKVWDRNPEIWSHSIAKRNVRCAPVSTKIQFLHAYASTAGAFDLGCGSRKTDLETGSSPKQMESWYYSVGAENITPFPLETYEETSSPFIIHQGHHGQKGAEQANIILPTTTFVERNGIFVNTEGRVQQTQTVTPPHFDARDDWQIMEALLDVLGFKERQVQITSFVSGRRSNAAASILRKDSHRGRNNWRNWRGPKGTLGTSNAFVPKFVVGSRTKPGWHLNDPGSWWRSPLEGTEKVSVNGCADFQDIAPQINMREDRNNNAGHAGARVVKQSFGIADFCPLGRPARHFGAMCNSGFVPLFDNSYSSNVIGQSPVTMGKCAQRFKSQNHNFSIQQRLWVKPSQPLCAN